MTELTDIQPEATDPSQAARFGAQSQYVTFLVEDRTYGIDIRLVREIKQWSSTTALPNQPIYTRGVLNLRGTIVPVHDLRARFGSGLTEATENHVVVIAWIGMKTVGILVDAVSDIVSVPNEEIKAVPSGPMSMDGSFVSGLVSSGDDMVALLDLNTLFPSAADDLS